METLEIQVAPRTPQRKRDAKRLRRNGKIPGVLYGPKTQPVPLQFDKREFSTRIAGLEGSHLVRLKSEASELADKVALVKHMQLDPLRGDVIHADLYEVDLTAKITVRVPLHFVGKAAGVVRGGILQPIVREVEVECLPLDIPQYFEVDVSALDIGDSIHIGELKVPDGVTIVAESDVALVSVVPPTVEEAPTPAAAQAPAEGAEAAPGAPAEAAKEEEKA
ncbi:MAG TPA: 50S ribosomal protein L25 [Candidatus Binatia bacterium]|nr:50S ribosomal protein L25 [Candidatus Binatia bacterium]